MTTDEINTLLLNRIEALTTQVDRLADAVKKNTEAANASTNASSDLKTTVTESNVVFEKVAQGVKDLYAKVQQIEVVAKLMKQFGPAILGGFGQKPKP
jgi:methyl-accepting chemotaxis protein